MSPNTAAIGRPQSQSLKADVETERSSIVRSGKLHRMHWAVVFISFVITLVAWDFSSTQVERNSTAQFEHATDQVLGLVAERMEKYEDGLWGGVALIRSHSGEVSLTEWQRYTQTLRIDKKYPGVNGIGLIHAIQPDHLSSYVDTQRIARPEFDVFPPHDGTLKLPITFIEPERVNAQAVGLDVAHEKNRYTAAINARDTGRAQITGPISLVQDAEHTAGFLFYAPYYLDQVQDTPRSRAANFVGMVYAPFVFRKLIAGTLGKDSRQFHFSVRDGEHLLYSESTDQTPAPDMGTPFTTRKELNLYGRTWTFDIWADPEFRKNMASSEPLLILMGGIFIDAMLFLLFVLLTRSNRRALEFTELVTRQLSYKADELSASNADLEKFAYMTSHDLKTPLRGMGDLAEYIEEDLEPYLTSEGANPQVAHNIDRMHNQILRMDNLIKGILVYSGIGHGDEHIEHTDVNDMVRYIREELSLSSRQVVLANELPNIQTNATRLNQVLANLIGNAAKYHDNLTHAVINVSSKTVGNWVHFSVEDNGPGIDARFHAKIFEPFQTLQPKDEIESTGIGLSIVKRSVEFYGGDIEISSAIGTGTKITFAWPVLLTAPILKGAA